jgi:hypothetical protein
MKDDARTETGGGEGRDPSENDIGLDGVVPRTEEQFYAREAGIVEELAQIGQTVTGDEREIGRAGEGGLDHASGRDATLGRDVGAPLTGSATPGEARALSRRVAKPGDARGSGRP